jgi:hypothetical protein
MLGAPARAMLVIAVTAIAVIPTSAAVVSTADLPRSQAAQELGRGATRAELLDLSPGVVKTQSMRALATLRVLLGEDEVIPAPPA